MASTKTRSTVKALTWRILSTTATTCFVWLVTGKISLALYVMAFDIGVMTGFYYFHERLWKQVKWGKYSDQEFEEDASEWARDRGWREPR